MNVKLSQEQLEALRRYAARRRTPVSWLIKDYVDYLLAGGTPLTRHEDEAPSTLEVAAAAESGGAFAWLDEEPDLYSTNDGEAV